MDKKLNKTERFPYSCHAEDLRDRSGVITKAYLGYPSISCPAELSLWLTYRGPEYCNSDNFRRINNENHFTRNTRPKEELIKNRMTRPATTGRASHRASNKDTASNFVEQELNISYTIYTLLIVKNNPYINSS